MKGHPAVVRSFAVGPRERPPGPPPFRDVTLNEEEPWPGMWMAQFVMTFIIAYLYTRFAQRTFDPLARALLAKLHARQGDAR